MLMNADVLNERVFLGFSGGVDSTSVAIIASQQLQQLTGHPLLAITGRNPEGFQQSSEAPYQEHVVQHLGMECSKYSGFDAINQIIIHFIRGD